MKPTRVLRLVLASVVLAATGFACSSSQTAPSSAAFSQTDLRVGTGAEAASGSVVTVNYTGWFYDASKTDKKGLQFDTTTGRTPLTFTLGSATVIVGWEQGVVGMRVGGLRRLVIPPSMAYGNMRYASIPPNTTLVFDVELTDVQ